LPLSVEQLTNRLNEIVQAPRSNDIQIQ